jgi:hypothetical protein
VRESAFPIYTSMLTTEWLRLLGARVGHGAEVSTVVGIPQLMRVGTHGFLADDTAHLPGTTQQNQGFYGRGAPPAIARLTSIVVGRAK